MTAMKFVAFAQALALSVLASGCGSTDGDAVFGCNAGDLSTVIFQPALSIDGTYKVIIERDGQEAPCTAKITKGTVSGDAGDFGCQGGNFITAGGQTKTYSSSGEGSSVSVSKPTNIERVYWLSMSNRAKVTVEKDGVLVRSQTVSLTRVAQASRCTGTR
jgi:hypothetical protein